TNKSFVVKIFSILTLLFNTSPMFFIPSTVNLLYFCLNFFLTRELISLESLLVNIKMKYQTAKILLFVTTFLVVYSCSTTKKVPEGQFLLTKNKYEFDTE